MGGAIEDAWDSVTGWAEDTFNWKNYERDPVGAITGAVVGAPLGPLGMAAGAAVGRSVGHEVKNWWGDIGGAKAWENLGDSITGMFDSGSYDLSSSGASSAAGAGGGACAKAPDETGVPAVARSISADAENAVAAQGTARKRARGIMQTYTRYDSSGETGGKSKLGE